MPAAQHLLNSTNIEGPHYAVSFSLLSLSPTHTFPSALLHFTTTVHIITQYHFLPLCERQSTELSCISITQWHFVENETEIMQHILKIQ